MNPRRLVLPWLCLLAPLVFSSEEEKVDFNRDIRPLISNRCIACHGPDEEERKAGLRLDEPQGATADLGGYAALAPGDAEASELYQRIIADDPSDLMPPPGKGQRFSEDEAALIRRWIEQGGQYARHWSYEPPRRPEIPASVSPGSDHPVDRFVRDRLEREGLSASPPGDRLALARRAAIDLTGMPPAWEDAEAFRDDESPGAFSRYVDRLMAKPAFGERWARVWLDLARYADSAGYADDPERVIWAYRDWVIRAFNDNIPFDRFTIEQIAGDLLEDPADDQIIATAFHRNTLTNSEGGTNDEEFRNVAVVDRVNTTLAVWMGTTMACAQCHTHKYDPITHEEYFSVFDIFNQTADTDKKDERPVFEVWTAAQRQEKAGLAESIAALEERIAGPSPAVAEERARWIERLRRPLAWRAGAPLSLEARSASLRLEGEGYIHAETAEGTDVYELTYDLAAGGGEALAAIKLEISPEQQSNFVLSRVSAFLEPAGGRRGLPARYVRVELPGEKRILQVAEVEVFSGGRNVGRGAAASASSVYADAAPERAVDGDTGGDYAAKSVFHSAEEKDPWLEIDLGREQEVDALTLWNRTDGGESVAQRIEGYRVVLLDAERREVHAETPAELPSPSRSLEISGIKTVRFARATASHEQAGFPAASLIADPADPDKGWAIAGGTGQAQELLLVPSAPVPAGEGTLRLVLAQESKHPEHLLRRFRVSFTTSGEAAERAAHPAAIVAAVTAAASPAAAETPEVTAHFQGVAPSLAPQRKELAGLKAKLEGMKPSTTVPVMQELPPGERRATHVHLRGEYQSLGPKVEAGVPAAFHPLREDFPPNRLGLAHWLVDSENPLTARVIANRFWEELFGIGIVETSEEFGSQGELPSHPELLDWLAVELMESGWDQKAFLKLLVTSETYRQSSRVDEELVRLDPFNRLLARGPRFRASAEMVRDQALAAARLLSDKRYGPPARPPQPVMGLSAAFGSKTDWETSEGEDRYRRAVYTQWRRSNPYPSMATFDAPNREVCTVRRNRSNTPLQALVTLNDPVYVEAAQAWGRLAAAEPGAFADKLRIRFRDTLTREPAPGEAERLRQLHEEARAAYQADPAMARAMAEDPLGPAPEGADLADLAAWTVVGNVVLNLDELFLKR